MASNLRPEGGQNSGDNVFEGIPVGKEEAAHFTGFLADHDFSENSRRAFTQDMRKFAAWFSSANRERFVVGRVTTRDVADFRDHLRREEGQTVATINRALVTVRRFLA
jgi:site-specific recombinase XerD